MKISFIDFWGGFDQKNNFLYFLMKDIFNNTEVVDPKDADVLFCSVFGNEHFSFKDKKKIFYTGENIRPNLDLYDYSFSFDIDNDDYRNIRLPLWYFYIDWFNVKSYNNPDYLIPVDYLLNDNEFTRNDKSKFCCTVFSAPYSDRINMKNLISSYKKVDGYGKCNENHIGYGEKLKMDIISNYKFSLCFENSIYPGYFTEKLLHAKIAGTIPIYKAHPLLNIDFNEKCCINAYGLSDREVLDKIIEIDNNKDLYNSIFKEPLYNELPNIEWLKKIILNIL
jgi:hypothetical protein